MSQTMTPSAKTGHDPMASCRSPFSGSRNSYRSQNAAKIASPAAAIRRLQCAPTEYSATSIGASEPTPSDVPNTATGRPSEIATTASTVNGARLRQTSASPAIAYEAATTPAGPTTFVARASTTPIAATAVASITSARTWWRSVQRDLTGRTYLRPVAVTSP